MTQTVEAPTDTRTHADPSANGMRTGDYREEAKKLAAQDYRHGSVDSTARRPRIRSRRGVRASGCRMRRYRLLTVSTA
jgi:hypothetical protein